LAALGLSLLKSALRGVGIPTAERWALLASDAVSSVQSLSERYQQQDPAAKGWDPLEQVLARLVEARLVITDGKHFLSLPVAVSQDPLAEPIPPLEGLEERVPSAA
jgi:hypothetical protein